MRVHAPAAEALEEPLADQLHEPGQYHQIGRVPRAGVREGHLKELFAAVGIAGVEEAVLTVAVEYPTFEDYWAPFELFTTVM